MHELALIQSVVESVVNVAVANQAKSVVSVTLRIGVMRDFVDALAEQYFGYCAAGTIAKGAKLVILKACVSVQCTECSHLREATRAEVMESGEFLCLNCGSRELQLISGDEFMIESVGVLG